MPICQGAQFAREHINKSTFFPNNRFTLGANFVYKVVRKAVNARSIKMLDGATVVPGSLVVKPVFYSHCYPDNQI